MESSMKEIVSTITSKGQVTLPAAVRKHLGLGTGDKVSFVIPDTGAVEIHVPQYPTVASLLGAPVTLSEDLTMGEMKEIAYEDRLAETYKPTV
jgi:antitoxin PrlF